MFVIFLNHLLYNQRQQKRNYDPQKVESFETIAYG